MRPRAAARPAQEPLAKRVVRLSETRPARIGVVADTHSRPDPRALDLLGALELDLLLHAGDIGDRAVLDRLAALAPSVHAVRGNIDGAAPDLPERLVIELRRGEAVLRILLIHIAVHGPHLLAPVRRLALSERIDLVVCGHSHVPFATREGEVAVFNPGSIGPRRFKLPVVFGVLELGERLSVRHIDCDTGTSWQPS
jgi:putative phosphoesterase